MFTPSPFAAPAYRSFSYAAAPMAYAAPTMIVPLSTSAIVQAPAAVAVGTTAPARHPKFGRFSLTIGGKQEDGPTTFGVVNPATGEAFVACPDASKSQVDRAVQAAKAAFPAWAALPLADRKAALEKCADAIEKDADVLTELLTTEQGKPLASAKSEVASTAFFFRLAAKSFSGEPEVVEDPNRTVRVFRKPVGVVGAITPWNYPLSQMAWKIPYALVAGNTTVLKPSQFTPLTSLRVATLCAGILPPGVFNAVIGSTNDCGIWVSTNPDVAIVSFTGSVAAGQSVQKSVSKDLRRCTLELGGNDAAIVAADVDVDKTAEKIAAFALANSGQVCIAVKRLFVHESIADRFARKLAEIAKGYKTGNGLDEGVKMGPINNKRQFERVCELVRDAKAHGAKTLCGGEPLPGPGYFFPATVLTGVREGVRVVDEEQFGPVIPVLPFKTMDEAIQRANSTDLGLGASIWTDDDALAASVSARLQAGMVWVNTHAGINVEMPFGGIKNSGIGRALGKHSFDEFTQMVTVMKA